MVQYCLVLQGLEVLLVLLVPCAGSAGGLPGWQARPCCVASLEGWMLETLALFTRHVEHAVQQVRVVGTSKVEVTSVPQGTCLGSLIASDVLLGATCTDEQLDSERTQA